MRPTLKLAKAAKRTGPSFIATALLAACGPDPTMTMRVNAPQQQVAPAPADSRVEVNRIGVFSDDLAYNSRRGVYVITDKATGNQYIGVSGIGISELGSHSTGKASIGDER